MMAGAGAISGAVLEALAIFPLPDVVLFPHAMLPLHVFEPRYRALVADVLEGSGLFAVPRLRPGYETGYQGRPAVFETAGIGVCVAADRLPDGRYNVMLRGLGRVRIERELPAGRAYRVVQSRILDDARSTRDAELGAAHHTLIALCDRLASSVEGNEEADALRQLARAVATPGGCADLVASALVRDADARQTLLELLDPADRLDQVTAHVTALLGRFGGGGSAPN
jgi:Lon protease-like protein